MSSTKDYYFEMQDKHCRAWIKQRHGVEVDQEKDPDLWETLAGEYLDMLEAEEDEAEHQWLNRHPHSALFNEFLLELGAASSLLELGLHNDQGDTINKLVYAHAVTLMEALISSVVLKLVLDDQELMLKLAAGYDDLSKKSFTLKQIAENPKIVESHVLPLLKKLSFHNVPTIREVLRAMFGEHVKAMELGDIARICNVRHDIVHRNGKTTNGETFR